MTSEIRSRRFGDGLRCPQHQFQAVQQQKKSPFLNRPKKQLPFDSAQMSKPTVPAQVTRTSSAPESTSSSKVAESKYGKDVPGHSSQVSFSSRSH